MTIITEYKVLDVREMNEVEWSVRSNSAYNNHYYVFILENAETHRRERWSSQNKKFVFSSSHGEVVAGDRILLEEETWAFHDTEYKITIF